MRGCTAILAVCIMLLASVDARQLQQKVKESDKPVMCTDAPPPLANNTWPATCKNMAQGFACKGQCAPGFNGQPTAVCQRQGGWAANGACKPIKCSAEDLPMVANATWGNCDGLPVGSTCTATCDGYLVASGPITVTCEAETKGASWSSTSEYCGTINTQALINIEGSGSCSEAGTLAVQQSVESFMSSQAGVNELKVDVKCFDTAPPGRRLQQTSVRYVVVVIYVGTEAAATTLVQTAETDLAAVGDVIYAVNTATGGSITLSQEGVTGDVSGGGSTPLNPEQDAKVSLLRSGAANLQTGAAFYLTAVYTGTKGFAEAGVEITGPTIDPAGSVICTAVAPAPLTDAVGTATWACTTGQTPGKVTITVEAPNQFSGTKVSATTSLTIGSDCVGSFGDWGACSNVCGAGERSRFYTITSPAADGGRACPYAQGANETEACTGETTCGECQQCGASGCEDKTAGTACTGGQCDTGVCQPSVDCVGSFGEFGACSNVCGAGEHTKFYTITTPAAYGGQACPYATGDNVTEACTGPTTCGECEECAVTGCVAKTTGTPCTGGQCDTGVCQPSVDCVGSFGEFGACSNVCGAGEHSKFYTITTPAAYGGQACPYATGDNVTEACTGPTTCGECEQCGASGCEPLANGTPCSNQGKCYDGTCQATSKLYEVKSISPAGTIPSNNSEWFWMRLYVAGSAVGEITTLSSQTSITTPAVVNGSVVSGAPEDPRTPGTPLSTALKMLNPTSSDRVETGVWYRNNTPSHPPGLFNGMKFKEFLESNGTLTFSWYRGDWPSMTVGSAPGFRFTVINPALLPAAAGGGSKSRIEFVFDPTYTLANNVPANTWVTQTVSLNQGKLFVYMGGYANTLYGAKQIDCYQPLSFWVDPAARCSSKQHPWLNPAINAELYGTDDIVRDGIIWEVRASSLNPKTLAYANNIQFTTDKGNKFTYVFSN